jgi:hypothetical protein
MNLNIIIARWRKRRRVLTSTYREWEGSFAYMKA